MNNWLKDNGKRLLMVFVLIIFLSSVLYFKNKAGQGASSQNYIKTENGLIFNDTDKISDLVSKDTDGDGVPDWEETLYGLDPTKKETVPGVPDVVTLKKLQDESGVASAPPGGTTGNENLSATDKFSRELFSTVTTLNQTGQIDGDTANKLSASLADKMINANPRKIYASADIQIAKTDGIQATLLYNDALNALSNKYPSKNNVVDIIKKFVADGETPDPSALPELDPIIKQISLFLEGLSKLSVPPSLATAHLDFMNGLERVKENLSDFRLYDADAILALNGLTQYQKNVDSFGTATAKLMTKIDQKLNN